MNFDLSNSDLWTGEDSLRVHRVIQHDAGYEPDAPYQSLEGRFSNGSRSVLYVADQAEGALAEWLRWHPELLELQDYLRVHVFQISISITSTSLDVRTEGQAALIPFPFERLVSDDRDESVRYRECRALADDCEAASGTGIRSPSAADPEFRRSNVTLFGEEGGDWHSDGYFEVPRPYIPVTAVRPLTS